MRPADEWLDQYDRHHAGGANRVLHWISVPFVVTGIVGLLWALPVPATFSDATPVLNWGTIFLMAAVVYYFIMSISLGFGILPFVVLIVAAVTWLDRLNYPLWISSMILLAVSWMLLRISNRRGSTRPSLVGDLQYMMLGPLWLLAAVYRRFGIPY